MIRYIRKHPAGGYVKGVGAGPTQDLNEARLYTRHQKSGLQKKAAYYAPDVVEADRARWVPVRVTVEIAS